MQSVCQKIGGTGPFDLHDRRPLQLSRNLSATARRSSTVSSFFSSGKFGSIIIKVYLCPVLRKTVHNTMAELDMVDNYIIFVIQLALRDGIDGE